MKSDSSNSTPERFASAADGGADPGMAPDSMRPATAKPSKLWLWFIAAFCLQAAAWTVWFIIASNHRIEEVPLATSHPGADAPRENERITK